MHTDVIGLVQCSAECTVTNTCSRKCKKETQYNCSNYAGTSVNIIPTNVKRKFTIEQTYKKIESQPQKFNHVFCSTDSTKNLYKLVVICWFNFDLSENSRKENSHLLGVSVGG